MNLSRFAGAAEAAAALAAQVGAALRQGLAARGVASLVVPGGRTPLPFFRSLREVELDWSRVGVTLSDERCVPDEDPGSNAALVRAQLLAAGAAAARFIPWQVNGGDATVAPAGVWQQLGALPRPFDAVVLGMGEDGHFASLFAGNVGLAAALDPAAAPGCVAMRAPVAPVERLSLNLAALVQTRRLFLLAAGERKLEVLHAAAYGASHDCPVAALLALRDPQVEVFWSP